VPLADNVVNAPVDGVFVPIVVLSIKPPLMSTLFDVKFVIVPVVTLMFAAVNVSNVKSTAGKLRVLVTAISPFESNVKNLPALVDESGNTPDVDAGSFAGN
jgi:hypothetical protein